MSSNLEGDGEYEFDSPIGEFSYELVTPWRVIGSAAVTIKKSDLFLQNMSLLITVNHHLISTALSMQEIFHTRIQLIPISTLNMAQHLLFALVVN